MESDFLEELPTLQINNKDVFQMKNARQNDRLIGSSSNPAISRWNIINSFRGFYQAYSEAGITPDEINTYFCTLQQNLIKDIPNIDNDTVNINIYTNQLVVKDDKTQQIDFSMGALVGSNYENFQDFI